MHRLLLVLVPALALPGLVFFIGVAVPWLLTNQPNPVPKQPIYFDHRVHVEEAGIDCAFCHRTAASGKAAGMPEVHQCMFCHQVIAGGQEMEKLRQAWAGQQPIDWHRIYRVPDHTHFPHDTHIQAGIGCATCHGNVSQMRVVVQARPLRMSDCVDCHQQMGAQTGCGTCHY